MQISIHLIRAIPHSYQMQSMLQRKNKALLLLLPHLNGKEIRKYFPHFCTRVQWSLFKQYFHLKMKRNGIKVIQWTKRWFRMKSHIYVNCVESTEEEKFRSNFVRCVKVSIFMYRWIVRSCVELGVCVVDGKNGNMEATTFVMLA